MHRRSAKERPYGEKGYYPEELKDHGCQETKVDGTRCKTQKVQTTAQRLKCSTNSLIYPIAWSPEVIDSQEPGTGGCAPVQTTGNSEDSDDFEDDGENFCVCGLFRPPVSLTSLVVYNWAQCDINCGHCVHLRFCSPVQNTSSHDVFYCPHCIEEWVPSLNWMLNLRNDNELLWKTDHNHQRHGRCLSNHWIFLTVIGCVYLFVLKQMRSCAVT